MKKIFLTLSVAASMLLAHGNHEGMHHHKNMPKKAKCVTEVSKKLQKNPSKEVMKMMHNPMMCAKWIESGDANRDFLENMIPHHKGAILASEALLKYTKNNEMKTIANQIIQEQTKEIKDFEAFLKKLPKEELADYKNFASKAKEDMKKMMEAMHKVSLSNNVDKDFLAAMIAHHQGAVDASKQILAVTKNEQIKAFAQNIINTQEKEIKNFEAMLKNIK